MNQYEIKAYGQLSDIQKKATISIFIEGFGHMMNFSKDNQELEALFSTAFNPFYTYAYVENDKVLGILGIATNAIRPIKLEQNQCVEIYGKFKGTVLFKQLNVIFQSQVVKSDTDIYIDILATTKAAKGRGVATRLIEYVLSLNEYKECYIEVLSKNLNAKRLYEKIGFAIYKKRPFSFITLRGQGYPIMMRYPIH